MERWGNSQLQNATDINEKKHREGTGGISAYLGLIPASSPSSASSSFPKKYTEEHIKCGSSTHAH